MRACVRACVLDCACFSLSYKYNTLGHVILKLPYFSAIKYVSVII